MNKNDNMKLFSLLVREHEKTGFNFSPRKKSMNGRSFNDGYLLNGDTKEYIDAGLVSSYCQKMKTVSIHFSWTGRSGNVNFAWCEGDDENILKIMNSIKQKYPQNVMEGDCTEKRQNYFWKFESKSMEDTVKALVQFCKDILYPEIERQKCKYLMEFDERNKNRIQAGKRVLEKFLK